MIWILKNPMKNEKQYLYQGDCFINVKNPWNIKLTKSHEIFQILWNEIPQIRNIMFL